MRCAARKNERPSKPNIVKNNCEDTVNVWCYTTVIGICQNCADIRVARYVNRGAALGDSRQLLHPKESFNPPEPKENLNRAHTRDFQGHFNGFHTPNPATTRPKVLYIMSELPGAVSQFETRYHTTPHEAYRANGTRSGLSLIHI